MKDKELKGGGARAGAPHVTASQRLLCEQRGLRTLSPTPLLGGLRRAQAGTKLFCKGRDSEYFRPRRPYGCSLGLGSVEAARVTVLNNPLETPI